VIYPVPKPAKREPKARKPLRRTRVRTRRTKARKGRLKGEEMSALRQWSWEERRSLCFYCHRPCSEKRDDLAHIRNKRMWGDNKENTAPAHKECHAIFHAYGPSMTKPVPTKERGE
jgi:hypothetical protein